MLKAASVLLTLQDGIGRRYWKYARIWLRGRTGHRETPQPLRSFSFLPLSWRLSLSLGPPGERRAGRRLGSRPPQCSHSRRRTRTFPSGGLLCPRSGPAHWLEHCGSRQVTSRGARRSFRLLLPEAPRRSRPWSIRVGCPPPRACKRGLLAVALVPSLPELLLTGWRLGTGDALFSACVSVPDL